jgi:hypothetical protein
MNRCKNVVPLLSTQPSHRKITILAESTSEFNSSRLWPTIPIGIQLPSDITLENEWEIGYFFLAWQMFQNTRISGSAIARAFREKGPNWPTDRDEQFHPSPPPRLKLALLQRAATDPSALR